MIQGFQKYDLIYFDFSLTNLHKFESLKSKWDFVFKMQNVNIT